MGIKYYFTKEPYIYELKNLISLIYPTCYTTGHALHGNTEEVHPDITTKPLFNIVTLKSYKHTNLYHDLVKEE